MSELLDGYTAWIVAAVSWTLLGGLAYYWQRRLGILSRALDHARARTEAGQRRFLTLALNTKEALIVIDPEGEVVFWNYGAERLFGWTATEMIGQSLERIMPGRHWRAHTAALKRLRAGHPPQLMERILNLEALDRNGREFLIELALGQWSDVDNPGPGDWSYVGIARRQSTFPPPSEP